MAIYHLSAKVHSRSTGASAVARAAYRAREMLVDERTGESHDFSRRDDLDGAEILAPRSAPEWARDRGQLWNQVEATERRKDAQVARELQIGLPVELSQEQRRELVREFLEDECVGRGMVADVAFHGGDGHNPHAHVLLTTRTIGPEGFGPKDRTWNDRKLLKRWRGEWATRANAALERAGRPERIDHRSLEAQRDEAIARGDVEKAVELDRAPDVHHGRSAWILAREGTATGTLARSRGRDVEAWEREEERKTLRAQLREVIVEIRSTKVAQQVERRMREAAARTQEWLRQTRQRGPDRDRGGGIER